MLGHLGVISAEDKQSARLVLSQELLVRFLRGGKIQGGGVNAELGTLASARIEGSDWLADRLLG